MKKEEDLSRVELTKEELSAISIEEFKSMNLATIMYTLDLNKEKEPGSMFHIMRLKELIPSLIVGGIKGDTLEAEKVNLVIFGALSYNVSLDSVSSVVSRMAELEEEYLSSNTKPEELNLIDFYKSLSKIDIIVSELVLSSLDSADMTPIDMDLIMNLMSILHSMIFFIQKQSIAVEEKEVK